MKPIRFLCLAWALFGVGGGFGIRCSAATFVGPKTQNIILVTTDGLRWQEVFTGADPELMNKENGGIRDTNAIRQTFWCGTPEARRETLMPFFWSILAKEGQIFGNQQKGSIARVTNGKNFSYPGYNELLAGYADPRIDSNQKRPNPNVTVLEWLHQRPAFRDGIAVFGGWDLYPYILNSERSGLLVKSGWEPVFQGKVNARQDLLNKLMHDTTPIWDGVALDSLVFHSALEYLRERKPRVLYIAFGETDEWGHEGRYDLLLHSASHVDRYLRILWETIQSLPGYSNQTTLIVTTDHGRGDAPQEWKSHGKDIKGSENIWMAFLGPDTPALGERVATESVTQSQIAATLAAFLREDFHAALPQSAPPIRDVLR